MLYKTLKIVNFMIGLFNMHLIGKSIITFHPKLLQKYNILIIYYQGNNHAIILNSYNYQIPLDQIDNLFSLIPIITNTR